MRRLTTALMAAALASNTAAAQTIDPRYDVADGWDYSILDTYVPHPGDPDKNWMKTNFGVVQDHKAEVAPRDSAYGYSGARGADGSRVADVDNDDAHLLDVLTVYEGSKELFVYLNDWNGKHYNAVYRQKIGDGCGASEEAIFFDFDGDGKPDIVCAATKEGGGVTGDRIYVYFNLIGTEACPKAVQSTGKDASACWSSKGAVVGAETPHKKWYRIGGDMGSIDFNNDNCPDLVIGSANGDVGVLWCPPSDRKTPASWVYQEIPWDADDGEVQRLMTMTYPIKGVPYTWLIWSVKSPNAGVYASKYFPNEQNPAQPGLFSKPVEIVDGVKSMEFDIGEIDGADANGDSYPDLVLPTRGDTGGVGLVRVYFGAPGLVAPWFQQTPLILTPAWESALCNRLRTYNVVKGAAIGDIWNNPNAPSGKTYNEIVIMGRGCPYASNGFFYFDPGSDDPAPTNPANYVWRSLTNQAGNIFQDQEVEKWDRPQLADMDCDGDLDVISADEEGDWYDTFRNGVNDPNPVRTGDDPNDYGVGTLIFWNPTVTASEPGCAAPMPN